MKHTKVLISALLIFSFLFSACAERPAPAAQAEPVAVEEEAPQAVPEAAAPAFLETEAAALPTPAPAPKVLSAEAGNLFGVKFEGSTVAGTGEKVDGAYRISAAKTDGEAWHVKLESNYPSVAGRDYRVTYRLRSDVEGKIKFGDFQEFEIHMGENTVTGMKIADGGTSYFDLQLGMLPAPFTIDFTEVRVEEFADQVDYENALPAPIKFEKESIVYERHDQGYGTILDRGNGEVTVNYVAAPWDPGVWKSKLYVKTGLIPEAGIHYHVTANVICDQDMPFEILFNDGDIEKGYGALYGQSITGGQVTRCEAVVSGSGEGEEIVLQFSLGEAPEGSVVKVSDIHVEKVVDHYSKILPVGFALDRTVATGRTKTKYVPTSSKNVSLSSFSYTGTDTVYEKHDDGYVVKLEEKADSATLKITQAPASDRGVWKVKLYAATGVTLAAGKTYRVKFNLKAAGSQGEYEVCFDGTSENAYGALYGRSIAAGATDTVEYTVTPEESRGPLTLRLQLGKTDTAAGNTFTVSNLTVESVTVSNTDLGGISYTTGTNVWEEHYDGVEQSLSASGSAATLNLTSARSGGGVWSSKLFIRTGVTPTAGAQYQVSANVSATAGLGDFEILYQNTGASDLYGGQWGLSGTGAFSSNFTAPASGCGELVLVFQLGNSAGNNTITVNNIKVTQSSSSMAEVTLSGFGYPVSTPASTTNNSFDLEANNGAAAVLSGNGTSATATVTTPGDDWHVKFYAKPGITLEAGETYTISMNVSGAAGCTACYKNTATGAEDGFGTESITSGTVTHTVTPAESGALEILLKIGNVPADTNVTVSNVKIEKAGADYVPVTLSGFGYPQDTDSKSFELETNSGTAGTLTGNGSSATATVTTPGADWNIKLYAKTGLTLEAGKSYQISMKVSGADGCPICYKNGTTFVEEGFGTETAGSGTVTHTVTPTEGGKLEIMLKLGALPADSTVTVSNIKVSEYQSVNVNVTPSGFAYPVSVPSSMDKKSFDLEANSGAAAFLSGNGTSATATVTTPGDDWHVKLYAKPGVTLEAGQQYTVTMNVTGAAGCTACYKNTATGAEDGFGTEAITSGTVTHTVTPTESGTLEILLKIGNVPANTAVTVSDVKVKKLTETTGSNLMTASLRSWAPINYWAHEDYAASLTGTGSSATIAINSAPASGREVWKVKLFAETGKTLTAGKTYRISADVKAASNLDYEICYNNGAAEKGVGAKYGLTATATPQTVKYEVTPESDAALILQFSLGNAAAGNAVTISNIKVEEIGMGTATSVLSGFKFNSVGYISSAADGGYITSLEQSSGSATFHILQAPATDRNTWNVKLNIRTGFTPAKGKGCKVTFDITSTKAQSAFEVFYDGTKEAGYGALYEQTLRAGKKTFTYTVMPDTGSGELVLQLRFGKTNGTDGNSYTISNLKLEEVTFTTSAAPEIKDAAELWTHDTYTSTLEKTKDKATVRIEKTPSVGREPWKTKLFIQTGTTLFPGKKYRVSMDVKSIIPAPFEVCFNNGDVEKGLGAIFGLISTPSGQFVEYTTYPEEETQLVIQLSLGNCTPPNSIVLGNLKVERAGAIDLVSDVTYTF